MDIAIEIFKQQYRGARLNQDALEICLKTAPRAERSGPETSPESFRLSVQADIEKILGSKVC
jgi:hypothetical protein